MIRPRTLILFAPALLIAVLVGTYLVSLPRAVQRAHRSPCVLLRVDHPKLDRQPGSLVFTDLDGKPYPISKLRGRLVLMNFWLTTCQPCLEELPSLLELINRYGTRGMMLVMVSADKKEKTVRAFLDKMPRLRRLTSAAVILRDPGGAIAKKLGTTKYPETYLIRPDGRWGGRVLGARRWTDRAITACLTTRLP